MKDAPWARRDAALAELAMGVAGFGLGITIAEIARDERGSARTAFARQVAMYLCNVVFELSLSRVAFAFGRDRSTVAHACHVVEDRRESERFDAWIANLEAMLRRAPAPGGEIWGELRA